MISKMIKFVKFFEQVLDSITKKFFVYLHTFDGLHDAHAWNQLSEIDCNGVQHHDILKRTYWTN